MDGVGVDHAALQARSRKRPPVQARVDAASPNLDVGDDVAERGIDIILKALDRRVVQREVERHGPDRIQLHSDLKGERPLRSEEHTSELQSLMHTSYTVFLLKKKTK